MESGCQLTSAGPSHQQGYTLLCRDCVLLPAFTACVYSRVIYKLMASKSESIRVQSLKVLGYFLKHLGHK